MSRTFLIKTMHTLLSKNNTKMEQLLPIKRRTFDLCLQLFTECFELIQRTALKDFRFPMNAFNQTG
jgi:hypothetical protein